MSKLRIVSLLAAGLLAAGGGSAQAAVVFFDSFSSGSAAAEFSGAGSVVGVGGYNSINGFADNFLHNDTGAIGAGTGLSTNLSLNGLAAHTSMTIEFDLAMIDSWDGTTPPHAPDYFRLLVDSTNAMVVSVDNGEQSTNEIVPTGATNRIPLQQLFGNGVVANPDPNCSSYFCDSGFSIALTLAHSSSSALLSFIANGSGYHSGIGALDESWAIDNVRVSTNAVTAVPLPAALPLFAAGLGLLGLFGWRRKRTASAV